MTQPAGPVRRGGDPGPARPRGPARGWQIGIAALTIFVFAAAARWHGSTPPAAGVSRWPVDAAGVVTPVPRVASSASVPAPSPLSAAIDLAAVDRLWTTGSLRGTELDGDWGRWAGGVLQPGRNLRRRFDQLLSTQGEAPLGALRAWIAARVRAEQGDAGAAQVIEVWDHYVQLQQTPFERKVDAADPGTWQAALAEQSRLRRQLLGSAWAEAFYGDEEREFAAFTSQQQARGALPAPADAAERALQPASADLPPERLQAERTARFGAEAAARLLTHDAVWAEWQRRIAAARVEWTALAAAPQLSPVQRDEAQQRLLQDRFTADELPRARALVPAAP